MRQANAFDGQVVAITMTMDQAKALRHLLDRDYHTSNAPDCYTFGPILEALNEVTDHDPKYADTPERAARVMQRLQMQRMQDSIEEMAEPPIIEQADPVKPRARVSRVACAVCGKAVKPRGLSRHMSLAHPWAVPAKEPAEAL